MARQALRLAVFLLLFALILPYPGAFAADQKGAANKQPVPAAEPRATDKPAHAGLVDLNTATAEELKNIPGIGAETAKRIIAGRPYVKKDQLKSRKIITADLYDKIQGRVIAKRVKIETDNK